MTDPSPRDPSPAPVALPPTSYTIRAIEDGHWVNSATGKCRACGEPYGDHGCPTVKAAVALQRDRMRDYRSPLLSDRVPRV